MTNLPNSHSVCGRLVITSLLLVVSVTPVALAEPTPGPPDEAVIVTLPFIDTGEQNRVIVAISPAKAIGHCS
jgi:hypothetical protein